MLRGLKKEREMIEAVGLRRRRVKALGSHGRTATGSIEDSKLSPIIRPCNFRISESAALQDSSDVPFQISHPPINDLTLRLYPDKDNR